jgi:hypothetical protein
MEQSWKSDRRHEVNRTVAFHFGHVHAGYPQPHLAALMPLPTTLVGQQIPQISNRPTNTAPTSIAGVMTAVRPVQMNNSPTATTRVLNPINQGADRCTQEQK